MEKKKSYLIKCVFWKGVKLNCRTPQTSTTYTGYIEEVCIVVVVFQVFCPGIILLWNSLWDITALVVFYLVFFNKFVLKLTVVLHICIIQCRTKKENTHLNNNKKTASLNQLQVLNSSFPSPFLTSFFPPSLDMFPLIKWLFQCTFQCLFIYLF